jgi:hypothetical protein
MIRTYKHAIVSACWSERMRAWHASIRLSNLKYISAVVVAVVVRNTIEQICAIPALF